MLNRALVTVWATVWSVFAHIGNLTTSDHATADNTTIAAVN
jgi:hypothetical protein